jgi:hypothetical protein
MILPYMCPIIENVPTFCILKENTFQINNLRRKQRDGKSHKKNNSLMHFYFKEHGVPC